MPKYRSKCNSPLEASVIKYRSDIVSPLDTNLIKYRSHAHSPLWWGGPSQLWFLRFFGDHNNIVAVDIPTFTYTICPDITNFTATSNALIDPNNQYYYIGSTHGVYVINLPAGTINTFISFAAYTTHEVRSIVIDRYNRILYALVYGYGGTNYIFRIDLSTHTIIDYGTPTTLGSADTAIINDINNDYIYVGSTQYYHRILLSGLTYLDSISGPIYIMSSVADIAHDYGYFACNLSPGLCKIQRLKLSTFVVDATCNLPTGARGYGALGIDISGGYLYYIPYDPTSPTNPVIMYQISLASFTIIQSTTIYAPGAGWADCLVVDSVNQKIYIGYMMTPGVTASIGRFDIASFTQDATLDYGDEATRGVIEFQNSV